MLTRLTRSMCVRQASRPVAVVVDEKLVFLQPEHRKRTSGMEDDGGSIHTFIRIPKILRVIFD